MDEENQAGTQGLHYAASKGLAVVIMEPLLGGRLANPPAKVWPLFYSEGAKRTPADWALQWVWDHPEVATVLSGMNTMDQVKGNLAAANASGVGLLDERELAFVARVRDTYRGLTPIPCTKCGYCMPCPNGVDIPGNFDLYNTGFIHDDFSGSRFVYTRYFAEKERAGSCVQCRECEEKCPQKIAVAEWMVKINATLGAAK